MPSRFFQLDTDRQRRDVPLDGSFAGPQPSACWLIGGGPSLARLPVEEIAASPIPTMAVNLAGARLLRPAFWTAYDPTVRFHRSIYLDPGVMKFVHSRRAMDVVPETTFKVCECPNLYFFERDRARSFGNVFATDAAVWSNRQAGKPAPRVGIVDWSDSMTQAIDVLHRLGFRVIYLTGCEMVVRPSASQIEAAKRRGVKYRPRERLREFVSRCEAAGLSAEELDALPAGEQYHFGEWKPIRSAANTDEHYFRITQYLRLSRRSMASAGLRLISVTPHSRLNDFFEYQPVRRALREIRRTVGDPRSERIAGLYRQPESRTPALLTAMHDFPSPGRQRGESAQAKSSNPIRLPQQSENEPEVLAEYEGYSPVVICEDG